MFFDEMPEPSRSRLLNHPMPDFGETPCIAGPALGDRRIALITTAGLHSWRDAPFAPGRAEYRTIATSMDMADLITSHPSTNIDRTGILRDIDTVFPIHRPPVNRWPPPPPCSSLTKRAAPTSIAADSFAAS